MIKAMFFDVDGTLVSFRTHRTTAAMADALEQLHRRGIKLFISTGRHPRMLQYLRDLFPFDGWVTMSGQFCYCGDQVIHRNPMDRQAVEELVSAAASNAFSCIFLEGHDIYINYANEQTHEFMKDLYLPLPPVQDPRRALDGELYQAITFLSKENEHLLGLGGEALHPGQQMAPVGVGGQALEVDDAGPDGDLLAEELDGLGPLQQAAAQGALRLITHKDHGALRPPQVVL